jgi:hypothetical protein
MYLFICGVYKEARTIVCSFDAISSSLSLTCSYIYILKNVELHGPIVQINVLVSSSLDFILTSMIAPQHHSLRCEV